MHQNGQQHRDATPKESDAHLGFIDLARAIIPQSVRLEPIHPNRERSIVDAINNEARNPLDRIGLAAERVVDSLLSSHVKMDHRRVIAWSTRLEPRHTIELDGVAQGQALLEYKISFKPERVAKECHRQLTKARDVIRCGHSEAPSRGLGVIVDCGTLVGLPPSPHQSTVQAVVDAIRNGSDAYSVRLISYEEVAEFFKCSQYAALLSPECLRAAWENRSRGERK
jgi:hypothetical protein